MPDWSNTNAVYGPPPPITACVVKGCAESAVAAGHCLEHVNSLIDFKVKDLVTAKLEDHAARAYSTWSRLFKSAETKYSADTTRAYRIHVFARGWLIERHRSSELRDRIERAIEAGIQSQGDTSPDMLAILQGENGMTKEQFDKFNVLQKEVYATRGHFNEETTRHEAATERLAEARAKLSTASTELQEFTRALTPGMLDIFKDG